MENLSQRKRPSLKRDIGNFIIEQITETVAKEKSPIASEGWPKLSKSYAAIKQELNGNKKANMELEGDMLDSLTFKPTGDGIKVGFFDDEAAKADGHNKFSGRTNNAPKRRFLPKTGQSFKFDSEIQEIITDALASDSRVKESDFSGVSSRVAMTRVLRGLFPDLSRGEIIGVIGRDQKIQKLLTRLNLVRFL